MRSAASILVTTAAAFALAPTADARWLAPTAIGQLGAASLAPAVAAGPDGSVATIFPAIDNGRVAFLSSVRPAGGSWEPSVVLEAPTSGISSVDVVIGPDGRTTAAWIATSGSRFGVRSSTRAAGGSWSEPADLSDNGSNAEQLTLASGPDGAVAATWRRYDGRRWIIEARVRPAGGGWGPAAAISAGGQDANSPRITLDGSGAAHALWARSNGSKTVIEWRMLPAGGSWSPTETLSSAAYSAGYPQLAVSPAGDAVVAWTLGTAPTSVQARLRPAGGAWEASTHDVSASGRAANEPLAGIDGSGNATVLWSESDGMHTLVRAAAHPAGGGWSGGGPLSAGGASAGALTLAVAPDGVAVAGWARFVGGAVVIEGARRPADGAAWQPAQQLSAGGRNALYPQVALDGRGNAVAVWDRASDADAAKHEIQAIGFDGEAPLLDGLSVPAAATVGDAVPLAVTAFDVWSPPAAVTWSFGDGTSVAGATASHRFAQAGEQQVTVTAVDAIGRQTSATRVVSVAPAPVVAPLPGPGPVAPGQGGGGGGPSAAPLRATLGAGG
ncbi:PKD domain-containing protein, partial [Conexibacter stalactiti]